jgi:hypothetical protein
MEQIKNGEFDFKQTNSLPNLCHAILSNSAKELRSSVMGLFNKRKGGCIIGQVKNGPFDFTKI